MLAVGDKPSGSTPEERGVDANEQNVSNEEDERWNDGSFPVEVRALLPDGRRPVGDGAGHDHGDDECSQYEHRIGGYLALALAMRWRHRAGMS